MHSRTWKRFETRAAEIIGGKRVWQKFSAGDAESEAFVADAKARASYSINELRADLAKLTGNPERNGRTPVVIVFDTPGSGPKAREPLVVMSASEFMAWHRGEKAE